MNQKEELEKLKNEEVEFLTRELSSQREFLEYLRNFRNSFIEHGYSTSVPDTMIAGWEARVQTIQSRLEELEKTD